MNYRAVIMSGIMTACLGSVFGWGAGQITLRRNSGQVQTTMSQPYQNLLQRRMIWIGAIAGFVLGAGQAGILAEKKREDQAMEREE